MTVDGVIISPSVASANQLMLAQAVKRAEERRCADLHIDIEDGNFIPSITFGIKTVRALRTATDLPFSFHLMTTKWEQWLGYAAETGASVVFAHSETLDYPKRFTAAARKLGIKCGLAFNPKTPTSDFVYLKDELDALLLLSVEPDEAGEHFIPSILEKIEQTRKLYETAEIWVDGNITFERLSVLHECGATHAVMGRDFFK